MPIAYKIEKLTEDHDVSGFDCGDESINRFLRVRAFKDQSEKYSSTYVMVNEENGDIMAYATVLNSVIRLTDVDKEDFPDFPYEKIPALLLARLGRDVSYRGKRFGETMIKYCVGLAQNLSRLVGCRLVCVDSYADKVPHYESLGFVRCSEEQPEEDGERKYVTLYYDLFDDI